MMSHPKVRLIVALVAAATITSASTARAENKKKSFAELLSPSISTATASSSGASLISQSSFTSRASSPSNGIQAATARGSLTLRQYQRLVFRELLQNRNNLYAALRLYRFELRSGQLTRAQFNASRANALQIWTGYSTALRSEYSTGTPYFFTSQIGVGPQAIQPGSFLVVRPPFGGTSPQVVPPITTIR